MTRSPSSRHAAARTGLRTSGSSCSGRKTSSPDNKINFILSEILVVLGFVFVSSLMSFFLFKIYSMEAVMINFYPNYIYLYCLQTLGPILVGFTICILMYTRNLGLRTTVAKESMEFLKKMF